VEKLLEEVDASAGSSVAGAPPSSPEALDSRVRLYERVASEVSITLVSCVVSSKRIIIYKKEISVESSHCLLFVMFISQYLGNTNKEILHERSQAIESKPQYLFKVSRLNFHAAKGASLPLVQQLAPRIQAATSKLKVRPRCGDSCEACSQTSSAIHFRSNAVPRPKQ